jgi:hypothetical protein
VLARRLAGITADSIRERNFELALGAFEKHGIPHVVVPVGTKARKRIDVPEPCRRLAVDALLATGALGAMVTVRNRFSTLRSPVPISSRAARRRLKRRSVLQWFLFEVYAGPPGSLALGEELACEVGFWPELEDGQAKRSFVEPTWNRLTASLPGTAFGTDATSRADLEAAASPYFGDVEFPIDVVYTWVDGADPKWIAARDDALAKLNIGVTNSEAFNRSRYESRDELRYSLRSLELFAGFVNKVWLVTADQRPEWLVDQHPQLTVVSHRDIFERAADLPTFNSHAIEARLHRVDGLSEHYIYMNDDFLFMRRAAAEDYFMSNGIALFFLSRARMPLGEPTKRTKPVDAAAMNGRRVISERFGLSITRKFKHAPYSQVKSVHQDLERWFPEAIARTVASNVRSSTDLALASSLHQYAAYATGRAAPGAIRSAYVDLAEPDLPFQLWALTHGQNMDTLCLNDTTTHESDFEGQGRIVQEWLEKSFPEKSSFER